MFNVFLAVGFAFAGSVASDFQGQWVTISHVLKKTPAPPEIDWMAYYKNSSAPRRREGRIEWAPVFVSPTMQWAVPNHVITGPPSTPWNNPYPYSPYNPSIPPASSSHNR